ncbi:MAG: hypothetical protein JSV03_00885 [Planctomycetota bacterium]|nr:MAG: hypothetical protein JSV03_00885 [Planctomycetota bacterium]
MAERNLDNLILVVAGASYRAEEMDRPLAYRIADEIAARLGSDTTWRTLVISDVLYINDKRLARCPTISIGGPGVNSLSALLFRELPSALTIDNVLLIQMDVDLEDLRCCLWGMDHEQTVESLELFLKRGYLDHFLCGVTSRATPQ